MTQKHKQIGVAVLGSTGRMGRRLLALIELACDIELAGAFARETPREFAAKPDVLIDFSTPDGTRAWLPFCREKRVPMVIGTTGLDSETHRAIDLAAADLAIVQSANMSAGASLLMNLAAQAATALGSEVQIEIVEAHHRKKKDAPSGTAKAIAEAIAKVLPSHLPAIHSIRLGDEIGRHTVHLASAGERLELTHVATDRDVFALGALRAARWILARPPGRYTMADVLAAARR